MPFTVVLIVTLIVIFQYFCDVVPFLGCERSSLCHHTLSKHHEVYYTHSLFFLLMYKKYLRGRHVTNSCMKPSLYNMKRFLITGFLLLIFAAFLSFNGKTLHLELSLSFFVKYTYTYALSFSLCKKYLRGRHVTTN